MREFLRSGTGIMGNAASLMLFVAPIVTFKRITRNRSTEEFSCLPYIVALFNCLTYTWYGLPVVSLRWENLPLVTINGLGALLESAFIIIYIRYTHPRQKKLAAVAVVTMGLAFVIIVIISRVAMSDHRERKMLVASVGLCASVAMYASPLVALKRVMETKSVEFMPFHLSLFSFLASFAWLVYGVLGHDLLLSTPNFFGCPLAMLQLLLYSLYRRRSATADLQLEKIAPQQCSQQSDLCDGRVEAEMGKTEEQQKLDLENGLQLKSGNMICCSTEIHKLASTEAVSPFFSH